MLLLRRRRYDLISPQTVLEAESLLTNQRYVQQAKFDVFNALTLHDNPLFLEDLKFGAGDGQLHYYLYNWRTPPIAGGVDKRNLPDEKQRGGIGMVLL
jgi:glycylpeptide N-tetradecanoyltransferase